MKKTDEEWDEGLTQTSLWDHCHPCAFICLMIQRGHLKAGPAVMKTLDSAGYMTPGGFPDFETMEREFERVSYESDGRSG